MAASVLLDETPVALCVPPQSWHGAAQVGHPHAQVNRDRQTERIRHLLISPSCLAFACQAVHALIGANQADKQNELVARETPVNGAAD